MSEQEGPSLVRTSMASDDVALVELNDPARYNALTAGMVTELKDVIAQLRDDRTTRAVVLAAEGKGFCAGANMGSGDEPPARAKDRGRCCNP